MSDKSTREGMANLYVVQDIPKQVTFYSYTRFNLTPENSSPILLKSIQANGAEVYTSGKWEKIPTTSKSDKEITLEFEPNASVASFNNQVFIRAQGAAKDWGNYGSLQISTPATKPTD